MNKSYVLKRELEELLQKIVFEAFCAFSELEVTQIKFNEKHIISNIDGLTLEGIKYIDFQGTKIVKIVQTYPDGYIYHKNDDEAIYNSEKLSALEASDLLWIIEQIENKEFTIKY